MLARKHKSARYISIANRYRKHKNKLLNASSASPSQDSTVQTNSSADTANLLDSTYEASNSKSDTDTNALFPSLSTLSKNNYSQDDCVSLTDTSLTSDDELTFDKQSPNSAPSSPAEQSPQTVTSYGYRQWKIRLNAVLTIQKCWMFHKRNERARELWKYKHGMEKRLYTSSAIKVQSLWRRIVAVKCFRCCIAAIVRIQSCERRVAARRVWRELQAEREEVRKVVSTRIQAAFRGCSVRSMIRREKASTMIQSVYRGYSAWGRYLQYQASAIIQAAFRGYNVRSKMEREVASTCIQAFYRGYSVRSKLQREKASTRIQTAFRGYLARWEGWRVRIATRVNCIQDKASTRIQAAFRDYLARRDYIKYRAITRIQAAFRRYIARSKCIQYRSSTKIQAAFRGWLTRWDYIEYRASIRIQAFYRGYLARCEYDLHDIIYDVVTCQSIVRRMFAIKTASKLRGPEYFRLKVAAKKIQAAYRTHRKGGTLTKRLLMKDRTFEYEDEEEDMLGLAVVRKVSENNLTYVIDTEDEAAFEAKCCNHSRCGLPDEVHQMLLEHGRWFYNKLGDPGVDTAENLVTVMELSEEATACFCWNATLPPSGAADKSGAPNAISNNTKSMGISSVVKVQSKWRAYVAAKKFIEMKKQQTQLV